MDRNDAARGRLDTVGKSLSARRAWIEIGKIHAKNSLTGVALRKESVDRNNEMMRKQQRTAVALRKESVDRNGEQGVAVFDGFCRSPQGERG